MGPESTQGVDRAELYDAAEPSTRQIEQSGEASVLTRELRASERPASLTNIGRYVVLGMLGQGGMGTVYEVFDPALDRLVAVKVLHRNVAGGHAERLVREAKALAQLSHPNVVQVYEVGRVEDQTFIAMELVKGQTLRTWLRQKPRPDWRACVEIYRQAGTGLAAAHEQGLVHRDFKPSNAIVDDKGRVRVLDFGLARTATDPASPECSGGEALDRRPTRSGFDVPVTETGVVVGTPAYMSLEQMRGHDVDARSDQFSFCVALHEALYGKRPFVGHTIAQLQLTLSAEQIAPEPRDTRVPKRLRELLLKGLARDPEQRWSSMDLLLERLGRLIAPRRHRGTLALYVAVASAVGTVGAGLVYQAERSQRCSGSSELLDGIWDEHTRQAIDDAIVDTQVPHADETRRYLSAHLDTYAQTLIGMHTEACEATLVRRERGEEEMHLRMRCLDERKTALRAAIKMLTRADAEVANRAVTMLTKLPSLSTCDDTDRLWERYRRVPPPTDPEVVAEVDALRERLADIEAERHAGKYTLALQRIEGVIEHAEALGYMPLVADAKLEQGRLQQRNGRYAEAEQTLTRAYTLAVEYGYDELIFESAKSLSYVVGNEQARPVEGLLWVHTALPLAKRSGDESRRATTLNILGILLYQQGKYEEAKQRHRQALQIREQVLGADHLLVAQSMNNLGNALDADKELEDAEHMYQQALAIRERVLGSRHPLVAESMHNLGISMANRGKLEEAEHWHRRALRITEPALGVAHPIVGTNIASLASALLRQGRYEEAEQHYRRALRIEEQSLREDHPNIATTLDTLGIALRAQGKAEQAERQHRRAIRIEEQSWGPEHPNLAASTNNLGDALQAQGRYDEAKREYRRALRIVERSLHPDHPDQAYPLSGLAKLAAHEHDDQALKEYAERILALPGLGELYPDALAEARFLLARALWSDPLERARARMLAQQARDAFAEAGASKANTLEQIQRWISEHGPP